MTRTDRAILAIAALVAAPAWAVPPTPTMVMVSGDGQAVNSVGGHVTFAPMVVKLLDAAGKPIANEPVVFGCGYFTGCYLEKPGDHGGWLSTDANGIVGATFHVDTDQSMPITVNVAAQVRGISGQQFNVRVIGR